MGVTDTEGDEKTETIRRIQEIYVHPKYQDYKADHSDHEYDIALVKLASSVDVRSPKNGVFPVCLAEAKVPEHFRFDAAGWVAGWGTRHEGRLETTTRLRHVKLPLVDRDTCQKALSTPDPARPVADHMFCAGFERGGADACQGDSGGAFVEKVRGETKWTQTGIVSWGRGCGRPGKYGVMVDVGFFFNWIVETIYDN